MDQIHKRLSLKFRLNKIENAGIFGPILLNELFHHHHPDRKTKLVQGYLQITSPAGTETCWHVWVTDDTTTKVWDINQQLATLSAPNFSLCQFNHSLELDEVNKENVKVDEEVKMYYEKYLEDKKEFWKKIPSHKIKNLRAKVFRNL